MSADPDTINADKGLTRFTLATLSDLVGLEKALQIVQTYGGTRLYIPTWQHLKGVHPLVTLLGVHDALLLCERFGGDSVKVPTGKRIFEKDRQTTIARRLKAGETAADLAREFGMTEDSIYRIAKTHRATLGGLATLPQAATHKRKTLLSRVSQLQTQANPPSLPQEGFTRLPVIALLLGVSASTIWRLVRNGKFPKPVKLTEKVTAWKCEEVRAWIEAQGSKGQGHE